MPAADTLDRKSMPQGMWARAASSIGGPEAKLTTELRKAMPQGFMGQRLPVFQDEAHVRQGVGMPSAAHGKVVAELLSGGGMQRDKARLVEFGLANVEERGGMGELHVPPRESERF